MIRSSWVASVLACACFASAAARAQEAPVAGNSAKSAEVTEHWSGADSRFFAAGITDMGALARAKVMLGYGKPHWTWAGFEGEGFSTPEAGMTAVRARIALLIADVAVAYRKTWAYRRSYLERKRAYSDKDLLGGPKTQYHSLDMWAWGLLPVGNGYFDWEFEVVRLYGVKRGVDVYEEWLRTPIRPPWATVCRLGYAHMFLDKRLAVGLMGEWVWPGPTGSVFRAGPLASWAFGPHWDFSMLLTAIVHGPDHIGFFNGMWGTLRFRFKFATGEKAKKRN